MTQPLEAAKETAYHVAMFLWILKMEQRMVWRQRQAWPLLLAAGILSLAAMCLPTRLSNPNASITEITLSIQLLFCLGFCLVVAIPSMGRGRFTLSQTRIGPLPTSSGHALLAHHLGQGIAMSTTWGALFGVQVLLCYGLMGAPPENSLIQSSLCALGAGWLLLAWSRLLATTLPAATSMLATTGLVVAGHYLLLAHGGSGLDLWGLASPGVEFALGGSSINTDLVNVGAAVALVSGATGTSNLLSAWILESWRGDLCKLDPAPDRA